MLAGCEVHAEGRRALPVVLDYLSERGLLEADPEHIAVKHGLGCAAVAEAIRAIKAVGPLGVAERSGFERLAIRNNAFPGRA